MADATLLGYGIWIVGPAAAVAALVTISLLDLFEETHVPAKTRRALTLVAAVAMLSASSGLVDQSDSTAVVTGRSVMIFSAGSGPGSRTIPAGGASVHSIRLHL